MSHQQNQECNAAVSTPQGGGHLETKLPASWSRLLLVISSHQEEPWRRMLSAAESKGQSQCLPPMNEMRADLPGSQVPPGVLATLPRRYFPSRSHDKGKLHSLKRMCSFAVNFAIQNLTPARGISLSLWLRMRNVSFKFFFLSFFFLMLHLRGYRQSGL